MDFLDKWWRECCGHANTQPCGRKAAEFGPACGLTVVGTDTEVGKTYVSQLLIRHLVSQGKCVGAYKPVASGSGTGSETSDAARLHRAAGLDCAIERVCPQNFLAALAPPLAAAREGKQVDEPLLRTGADWWREQCDLLVVEGAGGALSPIGRSSTVLDLAADLGYPVVLVAAHRLGMMNHVLLSLEAIRRRGLSVIALIINQLHTNHSAAWPSGTASDVEESLACLLPFCGKIACYRLDYEGSTLFPLA